MTVKELIKQLEKMPQDARVYHLWDGEPRTAINVVYEAKAGKVITADYNQVCYSDNARPKNAPNNKINKYWITEAGPDLTIDDWE